MISLLLFLTSHVSHAGLLPLLSQSHRNAACYLLLGSQNAEQTLPTLAKLDSLSMSPPVGADVFAATYSGKAAIEEYFRSMRIAAELLESSDLSAPRLSRFYRYAGFSITNLMTIYVAHQFAYGLPEITHAGTAFGLGLNAIELGVLGPVNINQSWLFRDWDDRRARKKIEELLAGSEPNLRGQNFVFSSIYQIDAELVDALEFYHPQRQNLLQATYYKAAVNESLSRLMRLFFKRKFPRHFVYRPVEVTRILHFDAETGEPQLIILVQTPNKTL